MLIIGLSIGLNFREHKEPKRFFLERAFKRFAVRDQGCSCQGAFRNWRLPVLRIFTTRLETWERHNGSHRPTYPVIESLVSRPPPPQSIHPSQRGRQATLEGGVGVWIRLQTNATETRGDQRGEDGGGAKEVEKHDWIRIYVYSEQSPTSICHTSKMYSNSIA